jgi:hypothetical protein
MTINHNRHFINYCARTTYTHPLYRTNYISRVQETPPGFPKFTLRNNIPFEININPPAVEVAGVNTTLPTAFYTNFHHQLLQQFNTAVGGTWRPTKLISTLNNYWISKEVENNNLPTDSTTRAEQDSEYFNSFSTVETDTFSTVAKSTQQNSTNTNLEVSTTGTLPLVQQYLLQLRKPLDQLPTSKYTTIIGYLQELPDIVHPILPGILPIPNNQIIDLTTSTVASSAYTENSGLTIVLPPETDSSITYSSNTTTPPHSIGQLVVASTGTCDSTTSGDISEPTGTSEVYYSPHLRTPSTNFATIYYLNHRWEFITPQTRAYYSSSEATVHVDSQGNIEIYVVVDPPILYPDPIGPGSVLSSGSLVTHPLAITYGLFHEEETLSTGSVVTSL